MVFGPIQRVARFGLGVTLGLAAVGCGQPASAPAPPAPSAALQPVVDVKRLMSGMVDPSADVVWQSVAVTMDRTGEHHTHPTTDEDWIEVQNHAMIVAESANLLMVAPRARDTGDWMAAARMLRDVGTKAYDAALKKDANAILTLGGELYDACVACHKKYLPPGEEDPI